MNEQCYDVGCAAERRHTEQHDCGSQDGIFGPGSGRVLGVEVYDEGESHDYDYDDGECCCEGLLDDEVDLHSACLFGGLFCGDVSLSVDLTRAVDWTAHLFCRQTLACFHVFVVLFLCSWHDDSDFLMFGVRD